MDTTSWFAPNPYRLAQAEKETGLLAGLNTLTQHHRNACPAYARIMKLTNADQKPATCLEEVPFLPVSLFKQQLLRSVPEEEVFKTLTSSGTTGQAVSRIVLDQTTARRQISALAAIIGHVIGAKRLPMLIVDTPSVVKNRTSFSARGAGVLGMMNFGRKHQYLLDDDMQLDHAALDAFLAEHGQAPFLIFGFTFMVWQHLYQAVRQRKPDLSQGILIHSGGWKKLQEIAVGNDAFKQALRDDCGLTRCYNFYGMVEQVGSVFLEGEDGFLYPPLFADVIVRDPYSWAPLPHGQEGLIEVLSLLPWSYPGHALLTEDLGTIHGVDDGTCGRLGKRFSVKGRLPKAELRGCSDTHAKEFTLR
ncbi:MAG: acyl-protein synthetase [Candidatus Sericytochromatia bacterium]|nr:acyl-protein synthetase [Candidatus Sericytochromatia bacterium]